MKLDKDRKAMLDIYLSVLLNSCCETNYKNIGGWQSWTGIKPHRFDEISSNLIDAVEKVLAMDETKAKQTLEKIKLMSEQKCQPNCIL